MDTAPRANRPDARARGAVLAFALTGLTLMVYVVLSGASSPRTGAPTGHIVLLKDSVKNPAAVAKRHAEAHDLKVTHVYSHALKGYAAMGSASETQELGGEPEVKHVQQGKGLQVMSEGPELYDRHGTRRDGSARNANFDLDGVDDFRVDADLAIFDAGMWEEVQSLNVFFRTNCVNPDPFRQHHGQYTPPVTENLDWHPNTRLNGASATPYGCLDNSGDPLPAPFPQYDPVSGGNHAIGVGNRGAQIENTKPQGSSQHGLGGVAPGARIWSVRVLATHESYGAYPNPATPGYPEEIEWLPEMGTAHLIAGLDWVAARDGEIDVIEMPLGCADVDMVPPEAEFKGVECEGDVLNAALAGVINEGVVPVVAAGNGGLLSPWHADAKYALPRNNLEALVVSSVVDSDGMPGGAATSGCGADGDDDERNEKSTAGLPVDIGAPFCGETSGASGKVAGAAAALASQCDPDSRADVEFIIDTLMAEGDTGEIAEGGWEDTSGDGWKEPLLNLRDEEVFDPVLLSTTDPELDDEPSPDGCEWRSHQPDSDIDDDGRTDLVTIDSDGGANALGGKVTGFDSANADTSQAGKLNPALLDGAGHYGLDLADVDGDREADLITAEGDGGVKVHLGSVDGSGNRVFGNGIESFSTALPVFNGSGTSEPIAVADVDDDGRDDFVSWVAGAVNKIAVAPGRTDGTFAPSGEGMALSLSSTQINPALTDKAGDYFLDVVDVTGEEIAEGEAIDYFDRSSHADLVTMDTDGYVYVYPGRADKTFSTTAGKTQVNPIMDDGVGEEPIGLGDVDRDRRADLLTLEGETLKLRLGNADGTFDAPIEPYDGDVDSSLLDGKGEELVGLADYSRDGLADLISVEEDGTLLTYTAQRDKTFAAPVAQSGSFPTTRVGATGHEFVTEKPLIRRAGCSPSGCEWPSKRGVEADIDRDGRSDLVTIHTDDEARVFGGTSAGFDGATPDISLKGALDPALQDGSGHYGIDVADVTGDSRPDLVTAEGDGGLKVHPGGVDGEGNRIFGNAVESFAAATPIFNGSGTTEPIAVADVDGNGCADSISWVAGAVNKIAVAPGRTDGTFAPSGEGMALSLSSTQINPALTDKAGDYFLDVVDVTGDGYADLVTMNTAGEVRVFPGQSNLAFNSTAAKTSVNPIMDDGKGEEPIGLGDANADGKADLVTFSDADGKLRLRLGQASGVFATATTPYGSAIDSSLLDGTGEELIGLLDNNRDGRADLVSVTAAGTLRTYSAQAGSPPTFAAPVNSSGSFPSTRNGSTGYEFVTEKPLIRRRGCAANGCSW